MVVAIWFCGVLSGCCVAWLVLASAGRIPGSAAAPWRSIWLAVLASTAAVATFLTVRFVAVESPVSSGVVMRGWFGFFVVFAGVFAVVAGLTTAIATRMRTPRDPGAHGVSSG